MVRCHQLNDQFQCNRQRYACEWMNEECQPISSIKALQMRRQEQSEAKGGWYKIMLILLVVILVLFMAIQQIFGINVFDSMSGDSGSTTPGTFIIILVLLAVLYGFYYLLKKCDFSFSCFLLGGEAGLMEQPIEHMRSEKYKRDKLKQHFFEQGQPMTFQMPRDRREEQLMNEERESSREIRRPSARMFNNDSDFATGN